MSAAEDLAARLRSQSMIDDPFLGPVTAGRFAAASPAWPQHGRWSGLKPGLVYGRAPSGRIAAFRAYEGPVRRTSPADEPASYR